MRIISGYLAGRSIKAVPGQGSRPILDRVKAGLFDSLQFGNWELGDQAEQDGFVGRRVLDCFAGCGSWGLEALSRGAGEVVFVELSNDAVRVLKENLSELGLSRAKEGARTEIKRTDVFSYIRRANRSFDLVFLDPPQYQGLWVEALQTIAENPGLIASEWQANEEKSKRGQGGLIVTKLHPKEYQPVEFKTLRLVKTKKTGSTLLLFHTVC